MRVHAVFSDSQNSPSLLAPSPIEVGNFVGMEVVLAIGNVGDAIEQQSRLRRSRPPAGTACRWGCPAKEY